MSTFPWPPLVDGTPWDATENPLVNKPGSTDGPYKTRADVGNGLIEQMMRSCHAYCFAIDPATPVNGTATEVAILDADDVPGTPAPLAALVGARVFRPGADGLWYTVTASGAWTTHQLLGSQLVYSSLHNEIWVATNTDGVAGSTDETADATSTQRLVASTDTNTRSDPSVSLWIPADQPVVELDGADVKLLVNEFDGRTFVAGETICQRGSNTLAISGFWTFATGDPPEVGDIVTRPVNIQGVPFDDLLHNSEVKIADGDTFGQSYAKVRQSGSPGSDEFERRDVTVPAYLVPGKVTSPNGSARLTRGGGGGEPGTLAIEVDSVLTVPLGIAFEIPDLETVMSDFDDAWPVNPWTEGDLVVVMDQADYTTNGLYEVGPVGVTYGLTNFQNICADVTQYNRLISIGHLALTTADVFDEEYEQNALRTIRPGSIDKLWIQSQLETLL